MEIFPQLLANGLVAASFYLLVALGFNLIYSTVRFFDLGYGALTAVGGYTVFYFARVLGWNLWLSILLALVIAGLIGLIINQLVYAPLVRRRASNMVKLVASLGVFTAIQAFLAILFTSQFQTLSALGRGRTYEIAGAVVTEIQLITFVVGIGVLLLLALWLKRSGFGKAIRAVADDKEVAKIIGLNTKRIVSVVFFVGSAIAGLAGLLVGFDTGLQPTMGLSLLLKGVIAAIVGGVGNIWGAAIGAGILGLVENFGIWKISGEWKDAIAFGLLIIFLIFRPSGLFKR
jgi:branched-chain amino acid transport system permease protein